MALVRFGSDFPIPALQKELERFLSNPAISLGLSGQGAYPPINVFDDGAGAVVVAEVPGLEPGRERGVSEFLAKLPRWLFLAPADFAAVNHHVILVSDAIDSDRTERQIIKAHAKHYGPYEGLIPSWPATNP